MPFIDSMYFSNVDMQSQFISLHKFKKNLLVEYAALLSVLIVHKKYPNIFCYMPCTITSGTISLWVYGSAALAVRTEVRRLSLCTSK